MKSSKRDNRPRFRVLLVDHDAAFGRRLAGFLHPPCGFRLCGHFFDVAEAQNAIAAENPDLVVADTDPDGTGALQLLHDLAAGAHQLRILAVSRRCDASQAEQVLLAGACGVLLKTEPAEEILSAFATVMRGQIYVSHAVTMPLLKRLLSERSQSARGGLESLTDRELRVFELLGAGLSKREVAARLGVSCKTVESHRAKIQHRLGIESAAALMVCACAWVQRSLRAGGPPTGGAGLGQRSEPQFSLP